MLPSQQPHLLFPGACPDVPTKRGPSSSLVSLELSRVGVSRAYREQVARSSEAGEILSD